ncbi:MULTISPECIES: hypothetical protein [unclassified Adlercreutzia]|uniref:hypothetical protein n=1 Tax=unclassified Adlercreutzia TaxID=2636013 RepID=UPI0013EDD586|nr:MULTISPECIES: hypothetical protein [unclassified Adlercreutzia]
MFEQDYLLRMLMDFAAAIRRSIERAGGQQDPSGAASMLEEAIGSAVDIDGGVLLSLSPESIASILEVSGTDPHVTEYVARSLLLASDYHAQAGEAELAELRRGQALAVAEAYGHDLSEAFDFEADIKL